MKRLLPIFLLLALVLCLSSTAQAQTNVLQLSVSTTDVPVVLDANVQYIVIRENSESPANAYLVKMAGSVIYQRVPAGGSYSFASSTAFPYKVGSTVAFVKLITGGPVNFSVTESPSAPAIITLRSGSSGGSGGAVTSVAGRTGSVTLSSSDVSGLATSATTDTTNAANISSGTLPAARLPTPGISSLGGVNSSAAVSHQFVTQIGTDGTILKAQPAAADVSGLAASATTDATNATNIASGTLGAARLPNPSATTLGGVKSLVATTHQFVTSIGTDGTPAKAQPVAADVSGLATSATTDTTNAANISTGTLPAARLPTPAVATLGGVNSSAAVSHQFLTQIGTDGSISKAQPAAADVSGLAASATTDTTNAANISSGALPAARLPALTGDCTTTAGTVATTCPNINGTAFAGANGDLVSYGPGNTPADSGIPVSTLANAPTTTAVVAGKELCGYTQTTAVFNTCNLAPFSPLTPSADTLTNATLTSEQFFASTYTLPANSITTNAVYTFMMGGDYTGTGTPATGTLRVRLCTTGLPTPSGCTIIFQSTAVAPGVNTRAAWLPVYVIGKATPATGATFVAFGGNGQSTTIWGADVKGSSLVTANTNAQLFLVYSIQYANTTASSSLQITSLFSMPGPII